MAYEHSKNRPLLGVDLSSAAVKTLELSRRGSRFKVESYAVEPLPDGVMVDDEVRDPVAVGAALARCVKRSGTKLRRCAMAMPSTAVFTKVITMPASLGPKELEGQVFVEIDQHIPYALEDVNLDFETLRRNAKNPELLDILVVASRRENVSLRESVADHAKLELDILDVEAFAIQGAAERMIEQIPGLDQNALVAVIDAGASATSIYVMSLSEGVVFTREQTFGGRMLTEEIMRRYELSYQQAGAAKMTGDLPADYIPAVLDPFRQGLVDQVQRLLQFFFLQQATATVAHILIGGGCAAIPGVDDQIEQATGTPVSIANPFRGMTLSGRVNKTRFANDAPALMTCAGLALRGSAV
ncbi:MAG: type IV pilus assembly protein PilM [Thioalkalivibrionaceae bacterium]